MESQHPRAVRARLIRTLDPARPVVKCLGLRDGRIVASGTADEVAAVVGGSTDWIDLGSATIVPGFTDSHIHLLEWALARARPDLSGFRELDRLLARVAEVCRGTDDHVVWLEFVGWDPALADRADLARLDAATGNRVVALISHDLHSGWLNSHALRRVGLVGAGAAPPGGVLDRASDGGLTGVVRESALDRWYEARPEPSSLEARRAIGAGQAALHALGVTALHSVEGPRALRELQEMERRDELRLRVLHHVPHRHLDSLIATGIASGFGGPWLRLGGVKIFTDGALGSRTAWMLEPYQGMETRGVLRVDPDEFRADVERAYRAGIAATVHAIGDAAVRLTLDTVEPLTDEPLRIPHRIEHLQCVHSDDVARAGRAGIVASMQPSHLLTDIPLAEEAWGAARCKGAFALRDLLEAGTILAFGSDAPVEKPDPREGFYAARVRRDRHGDPADGWYPDQCLDGTDVLEAYTVGPARAAGDSERRGRLAPGYFADFAAWDVDLAACEPEAITSARALLTVVGGRVVHRA